MLYITTYYKNNEALQGEQALIEGDDFMGAALAWLEINDDEAKSLYGSLIVTEESKKGIQCHSTRVGNDLLAIEPVNTKSIAGLQVSNRLRSLEALKAII